MQQLSGREAELHRQVNSMSYAAGISGKTLEQYIHKFIQNADPDFVMQGGIMQALVTRWHSTTDAMLALKNSSVVGRPWAFLSHLDAEVFQSTFQQYTFGIPFNAEGCLYALIGVFMGYLICSGLSFVCRSSYQYFRSKRLRHSH